MQVLCYVSQQAVGLRYEKSSYYQNYKDALIGCLSQIVQFWPKDGQIDLEQVGQGWVKPPL